MQEFVNPYMLSKYHNRPHSSQHSQPKPVTMDQITEYSRSRKIPKGVHIPATYSQSEPQYRDRDSREVHDRESSSDGDAPSYKSDSMRSCTRSAHRYRHRLSSPPKIPALSKAQLQVLKDRNNNDLRRYAMSRMYSVGLESLIQSGWLPHEKNWINTENVDQDIGPSTFEQAAAQLHSKSNAKKVSQSYEIAVEVEPKQRVDDGADTSHAEEQHFDEDALRELQRQDYKWWAHRYAVVRDSILEAELLKFVQS